MNNKEEIEEYIKNFEINLANAEKVGVAFLIVGYSNYIYAANLDILDSQNINNTNKSSEEIFASSQVLVLLGYILLFIVSSNRLYIKYFSNVYKKEDNDLISYKSIANSYLISIYANLIRLEFFNKLSKERCEKNNK